MSTIIAEDGAGVGVVDDNQPSTDPSLLSIPTESPPMTPITNGTTSSSRREPKIKESLSAPTTPRPQVRQQYGTLPFFHQSRLNFASDGGEYNTPERAATDEHQFIQYWFDRYRQRIRISFVLFAVVAILIGTPSVSSTGDSPLLPHFIVSWIYWLAVPIELAAIGITLTFVITGPTKPVGDAEVGGLPSWFEECSWGLIVLTARLASVFWSATPLEALATVLSPYGIGLLGVILVGPLAQRYIPTFQLLAPLVALGFIGNIGSSSLLGFPWALFLSILGFFTGYASLVFSHRDEMNLRQFWWQQRTLKEHPSLVDYTQLPFFQEQLGKVADVDAPLLDSIKDVKFTPVFVIGPHRSGTTFLYEKLISITNGAKLTAWDCVNQPRMLRAHQDGTIEQEKINMTNYWKAIGVRDRQIDTVLVNSDTPEEYGFICGHATIAMNLPKAPEVIRQMCQKLVVTQKPTPEGFVLLKNPWDFGWEDGIERVFPNAKYIYIQRNPGEIFDSYLNLSGFHVAMRKHEPYFWLLSPKWVQLIISGQRIMFSVWGERLYTAFTCWQWGNYFIQQHLLARQSLGKLPKERIHVCRYTDVVRNLPAELTRISEFLGIEFHEDQVVAARGNAKRKLEASIDVSAAKARFMAKMEKAGLPLDEHTSLF